MVDKVRALFGSRRFWLITVGAVATVGVQWSNGEINVDSVLDVFQAWVAAVVVVGTADRFGGK